ncbi:hypothetical protein CD133_10110 [Staphylococcus massiliensis CCUG 55927]|nr:hypothetical protein CD133_10110 [Staphylococcus massiliensis CCUG 55927]
MILDDHLETLILILFSMIASAISLTIAHIKLKKVSLLKKILVTLIIFIIIYVFLLVVFFYMLN